MIVDKLKNFGNGMHAHTANKCVFHIELAKKNGNDNRINKLTKFAEEAMLSGNWKHLKIYMKKWF